MDKPANRFYGEQRVEIKPGEYGKFRVTKRLTPDTIGVSFPVTPYDDSVGFSYLTAEELREAAHLFNQLAEALERE